MPKNSMNDLRNHLFEALEGLKDDEKPMDLERAKTVVQVAQAIINSAKVEVDLINAIGGDRASSFFGLAEPGAQLPALPGGKVRQIGAGR